MSFVDSWLKKPIARWLLGGLVAATVATGLGVNSFKPQELTYHTLQFRALNGGLEEAATEVDA